MNNKLLDAARKLCEAMPEIEEKTQSQYVTGGLEELYHDKSREGSWTYFSPAHVGCDSKLVWELRKAIEEEDARIDEPDNDPEDLSQ